MIIIRTNLEKMPTTCCDCPLKAYDPKIVWKDALMTQWGGWVCPISGQLIDNTKREKFCPLEEFSEPQKEDGWYQVYSPGYSGGSSSGLKNIQCESD